MQILLLLTGLAFVVFGADYLVDGSSSIARKAGLSEFVIGLTIVGIGTSTPEMVVSFIGAFQGNADISVGNIVGSNIFNVLLILGLTALIRPIQMTRNNIRKDIPINIIVSVLLVVFGLHRTLFGIGKSDTLSRMDGIVFLLLFACYLIYSFKSGKVEKKLEDTEGKNERRLGVSILMVCAGLAALVFGGRLFVDSAKFIASAAGMSDKFIAVTVLAGGTSMPELVTCVVAALKKKGQLALGNIIGSNISNILLILGGSAVICPLSFSGMSYVDIGVLFLSSLLLWASAFTGHGRRIDKADGILFLACEAAYMTWLIINL